MVKVGWRMPDKKANSAFDRFERLTKGLLAVPKKEVDRKRAEFKKGEEETKKNH